MSTIGISRSFLIAVAMLAASPAVGAEITRSEVHGEVVISIRGRLAMGDDVKFFRLTTDLNRAVVALDSPGGYIVPAIGIGGTIQDRGFDTLVRDGATCNSACPLIWFAGRYRYLGRRARLGLHSAYYRGTRQRGEDTNINIGEYLRRIGNIPTSVIELQPKADPSSLNYIGYSEAKALGLVRDTPAPPPRP